MKLSTSIFVSAFVIIALQFLALDDAHAVLRGKAVTARDSAAASSLVIIELLDSKFGFRAICTGSVIGPNTVLTAGHCFDPTVVKGVARFNVIFENSYSRFGTRNSRQGSKWVVHPSYRYPLEWDMDVAIVSFEGELPKDVTPAILEKDQERDFGGVLVEVYGYGRSKPYTGIQGEDMWDSVGTLRRLKTRVDEDYSARADRYYISWENNFACQGDSGGPQFYTENGVTRIIGINSANIGNVLPNGIQNCDKQSLVIKASSVASWVSEAQKKLSRTTKK